MKEIDKLSKLLNKNRKLSWIIFISYIVIFIGCVNFPIFTKHIGTINIVQHLVNGVYILPLMFAALLGKNKFKQVYAVSFVSLLIGMICRYFIEFGEVSNVQNFTVVNIASFLVILPVVYVGAYYLYSRKLK